MSISFIKRNDTAPALESTLTDIDSSGATVPVDLTSASAIRVIGSRDGVVLFDRTVTGNSAGVVDMPWQTGDTAYLGPIRVEWSVDWPDGATQTFPASGYETVWVTKDLDVGAAVSPVAGGASFNDLRAWALSESYTIVDDTRDGNGVLTGAVILWPDNTPGVFTADTVNSTWFAVDAYHITYAPTVGLPRTVTQPLVTRDSNGAVSAQPALVVN